ncbi:hypothetical protein ABWH74_001082 [Burkholderia vietnamiensis]|uniref:hypothetical protein n=1 Tax=Burkholderia vietnamiensis TaxID=60552 RepID=UPI00075EFAC6|nr:hypothetical protein [Burkholderia vietnamiensis]AOK00339.1 hypothetical protein WK23_17870 [Burkholderia vietnamiensis]KVE27718.1 hypothetical protein WI93_11830 [Burkholderia vietnamiensis]MBR8219608.1 hypothetical protein [Burkholderia vietnamiensis]TPQ43375.1 hypothetical protein C2U71_18905 [Burkholderia ubonensis]
MKKILAALAIPLCISMAACGGGDSDSPAAPSKFAVKLTFSGAPLVSSPKTARMAATDVASGASSTGSVSAGQATVNALQQKFSDAGTGITVYPGVIDGTTLHQIVMSVNNGVGPTDAELQNAKVPVVSSEWMVVNFQLDDMQTGSNDPAQIAALDQFKKDLIVFQNRVYLEGKSLYKILPIRTCDLPAGQTAADGLIDVLQRVPGGGYLMGLNYAPDKSHMGADCRTPDQETQDAYVNAIVTPIVASYNAVNQQVNDCKTHPETRPARDCFGITPNSP